MEGLEIIEYEDRFAADFKRLNLEWLDKYNLTESYDMIVLDDPRGNVIEPGGVIYLAVVGEEMVGSLGLMKTADGEYELVKMFVAEQWQGKGISKMLIDKCLQTAKDWKAKKIFLYSNSQLQRAIKIYERYGFKHTEAVNSPLLTADVHMELIL